MNQRKIRSIFFVAAMLIFVFITELENISFHEVNADISVEFIVENVFWGNPPSNTITVNPGDTNVPLTVVIRNNSNNTLRGVIGYLNLSYPFWDYITDSYVAKASAQPVESGDVFNQTGDILPSGSFTFTFQLNIDRNATKSAYRYNLTIHYNVKQGDVFIPGTPQTLEITIRIYNRAPTIYSVNPTSGTLTVSVGQHVNFSCKADDPDGDNITYEWSFDGETVGYGPNYTFIATEKDLGSHTLTVEVSDGNLTDSNSWTINVVRNPTTKLWVSNQYIYGGYDNAIRINITNDVWVGRVEASMTVPQYLVIVGNSSWIWENVSPNDTITLEATIYAPESLIGQTMQINLVVNYRDEYGSSYSESFAIGLVIRGKIVIKAYGLFATPNKAKPGEKISVSGTLLNIGNVKAMFTNVSIVPNPILDLTYESFAYIGDIDPNSPVPFTVVAYIKPGTSNGTYPIKISVYYMDDLREEHTFELTLYITVEQIQETSTGEETSSGVLEFLQGGGFALIGIVTVTIILGVMYFRRRT